MPVDKLAYRRGPKPAPFEFRGTSGWTITVDMDSREVVAARQSLAPMRAQRP
jgi:hypothetical protein